jgi:TonB family protein
MKRYIPEITTIALLLTPVLIYAQESTKTLGSATPKITIVSSRGDSVVPREIELSSLKPSQTVKVFSKQGDSMVSSEMELVSNLPGTQDKQSKKEPPQDYVPYDKAPEVTKQVQPKYPAAAMKDSAEGTVWTKVWIDESGKIAKAELQKSDAEIFNQAALDAVKQWTFKPAMKDGKAIATWVAIPFRFKIQKGGGPTDYTLSPSAPLLIGVNPRLGYRVLRQPPYLIGQSPSPTNDWYPEAAIKDEFEGTVMLKLTVNVGGRVDRVEIEGHSREDLDSAAVHLARTWTFIPGQTSGMPEKSIIRVPVGFYLGRPQK